ncbi:O-antigen ligase family protein [Patescibacteria group bacterium]|nr:O-antigen ligase family protein [Patescibacteria group bacterium]
MILLEKIFFYLLVFCLPFQTRKIIYQWGDGFNEWASVYLYLTDILLILVFLLWIWRIRKERFLILRRAQDIIKSSSFWLGAFLIVSLFSLIEARNLPLGFYAWFKLLELAGLFFYLKYNFKDLFDFDSLARVFVASGLFQALIALGQFAQQRSLGLRWLTESPLGVEIDGVAKIVVGNLTLLRPYGSLPHPNVLATFLLISILFIYYLWLKREHSFFVNLLLITNYLLLVIALFFTFSRVIIFVFLLSSLVYLILNRKLGKKVLGIFLLLIILCSMFFILAWPEISNRFSLSLEDQTISLRSFYNQVSFSLINESPWQGVGLGNFVWEMKEIFPLLNDWIHQPVHNIYLLISSEVGLIGLIIFLMFLYRLLFQRSNRMLFILFLCLLLIGLFDHFFWTLQQGQLMFWLILGLLSSAEYNGSNL